MVFGSSRRGPRALGLLVAITLGTLLIALAPTESFGATTRSVTVTLPSTAVPNARVLARGTVTNSPAGTAVYIRRWSRTGWTTAGIAHTATTRGGYSIYVAVPGAPGNYTYDAYVRGTSTRSAAVSGNHVVVVRIALRVTLSVDSTRPPDGYQIGLTGTVTPHSSSSAPVTAHLQREVGTATTWSNIRLITLNSAGGYSVYDTPVADRPNRYRIAVAASGTYRAAVSPIVTVTPHVPVPAPTGFKAHPDTAGVKVLLSWDQVPGTDPNTSAPANSQTVVIRRTTGNVPPTSPTAGVLVAAVPAPRTSATDASVANGATYAYSIFLEDTSGNFSLAGQPSRVVTMPDAPRHVAASWLWPSATHLDAEHGQTMSISCPTAKFCASVDNTGAVATYDGSSWSGWTPVDYAALSGPSGTGFTSLSCPTATFCVAVDGNGGYVTFDGTTWSAPAVALANSGELADLSCPTTTFCVARNDKGEVITYNGATWNAPVTVSTSGISALTCASPTFCLAGGTQGQIYTDTGTGWASSATVFNGPPGTNTVKSISCATNTFCVASSTSYTSTFDGTHWSTPASMPTQPYPFGQANTAPLADVSCATPPDCMAIDEGGSAWLYNGSDWSWQGVVDPIASLSGISCPSPTACRAIDVEGGFISYDGGSWSSRASMGDLVAQLETVSCPSDSYCMAGEPEGNQRTYNGATWSALTPALVRGVFGLSCISSSFCGALDGFGQVDVWNGSSWKNLSDFSTAGSGDASCVMDTAHHPDCFEIDNNGNIASYTPTAGPTALRSSGFTGERFTSSCLPDDFCVYVGDKGHAVVQTPALTTASATLGGRLSGVSCVSDTFCMAVDTTGYFWIYNGTTWSTATQINYDQTTTGVSCASSTACVMTDFAGGVRTWDGQGWSERTSVFPHGRIWDSSCPPAGLTCTVVGDDAGYEATATVIHP